MLDFINKHYDSDIQKIYRLNRIAASRSDLARLMLLHEFGGIYVDASLEFFSTLDCLIGESDDLVFVRRDDWPTFRENPDAAHVTNAILGSAAASTFIQEALERAVANLKEGNLNYQVWHATGPKILNDLLASGKAQRTSTKILRYTTITTNHAIHRRDRDAPPGERLLNKWTEEQKSGILPESFLDQWKRQ
jgi:mannosyltransferase OCH1-like enzyme